MGPRKMSNSKKPMVPQSVATQIYEEMRKQNKGRFVIDPRSAKYLGIWDCSTAVASS